MTTRFQRRRSKKKSSGSSIFFFCSEDIEKLSDIMFVFYDLTAMHYHGKDGPFYATLNT